MVLQGTGDWLMSLLPDDPENTILKRLKKPGSEGDSGSLQGAPADEEGYAKSARDGLRNLIDGKPATR
jgi:membrane protein required for colicin V production